ncbi:uncharacterized mitochondrial protein-like protein [Tanacetum coccineum]
MAISLPQDVLSTSDRRLIELENQVQRLMEAHLAPKSPIQVNKIASSCEICSGPHDTQYCMENPDQAFTEYAPSRTDKAGGKWYTFKPEQNNHGDTYNSSWKSHPNLRLSMFEADFKQQGEMTNKIDTFLKAINDRITGALPSDMVKNPKLDVNSTSPVLFMSECRVVGRRRLRGKERGGAGDGGSAEEGMARDLLLNPFKDVLVLRKMVEFFGAIPINLKGNMWQSKELIKKKIDWNRPPKEGDGAWIKRLHDDLEVTAAKVRVTAAKQNLVLFSNFNEKYAKKSIQVVYKVEKALYGLHQAPRAWYETFLTYLLDNGFQRGKIDKTLFIRRDKGDILLVQLYVDDIIFGSTKKSLCTEFEKIMHKKFQMSSMGELIFFLGLQVKQKEDGIFISQDKYVTEILKKFGFTNVKTASTPMETQKPLLKDEDGEEVDVHLYRSMIGSLMYLSSSRPDNMFAVCACAKYQVKPKVSHLHAVKRIFRYLKGQPK